MINSAHNSSEITVWTVIYASMRCKKDKSHKDAEYASARHLYPHMQIGNVWIYHLLFVILFVCTVTDFSAEDRANSVKFCTAVHWCPRQGICHFC